MKDISIHKVLEQMGEHKRMILWKTWNNRLSLRSTIRSAWTHAKIDKNTQNQPQHIFCNDIADNINHWNDKLYVVQGTHQCKLPWILEVLAGPHHLPNTLAVTHEVVASRSKAVVVTFITKFSYLKQQKLVSHEGSNRNGNEMLWKFKKILQAPWAKILIMEMQVGFSRITENITRF